MKRDISGVLLFDKDAGKSSNFVLQKVRRLYQAEKAGHLGTLDPFAEGLLPILFGEAAKFANWLILERKNYHVEILFGIQTDTDDITGSIINKTTVPDLKSIDWQNILNSFLGRQLQIPPKYSALKINGKRAYQLAREGLDVEIKPREIEIYALNLLEINNDSIVINVDCSKGTYIRSLARDIAQKINCYACAKNLRRNSIGIFSKDKYPFYKLSQLENILLNQLDSYLLNIEDCLINLEKIRIPDEKLRFIKNGNDINFYNNDLIEKEYLLYDGANRFLGIGRLENSRVYPLRLLKNKFN